MIDGLVFILTQVEDGGDTAKHLMDTQQGVRGVLRGEGCKVWGDNAKHLRQRHPARSEGQCRVKCKGVSIVTQGDRE